MAVLSSFCPVISISRLFLTSCRQLSTFRSEPNTVLQPSTSPQIDDPAYAQAISPSHRSIAYRLDLAGQLVARACGVSDPANLPQIDERFAHAHIPSQWERRSSYLKSDDFA